MLDTEGNGSNPIDALLASLCGCMGHMTREYLAKNGINSDGFTIQAESTLTTDGIRLSDIKLSIDMKNTIFKNQQKAGLLEYIEKCKIFNTLKSGCSIKTVLT